MKQFVVIGLGQFGLTIAKTLVEKGAQVIAIDNDMEKVRDAIPFVTRALQLDARDEDALKDVGISDVDAAIVAIGEDIATSIIVTLLLKSLGIETIVAKAISPLHGKMLKKLGVTKVIYPEEEVGKKVSESLLSPEIFDVIPLSSTHSLIEIESPKIFINKTLMENNIRKNYGVEVIAIKRLINQTDKNGKVSFTEQMIVAPGAKDKIIEGDKLIILGETKNIEKIKKLK